MTFLNKIKTRSCTLYTHIPINKNQVYKKLIFLTFVGTILYFLFYCPSSKITQEGLINFLSNRNPPNWLVPSLPGESIDIQQTKNFKRLKLAEFNKKTYLLKLDVKNALGIEKNLDEENKGDKSSWKILKDDLSDATSTFVEFWGITIVTDQNQNQTMIVGAGLHPININDRVLRWQKEIETAAEKYHLEPALLAAVIEQESGGESEALSPVGAIGLMQLMPSTAELMGVNPYDPAQNIEGGAHYLELQFESFGNVQAALAAYNAGPGEVQNGHWVTIPETLNYVQKVPILARKYEQIWQENSAKSEVAQEVMSTP